MLRSSILYRITAAEVVEQNVVRCFLVDFIKVLEGGVEGRSEVDAILSEVFANEAMLPVLFLVVVGKE